MTAIVQRPFRGARISSFYPVKTLPSLASLDSAFQLQEYISLLIRLDVHDVERIVNLPEKSKNGDTDGDKKTDANVDQYCWIYEQLRRLAQDLTHPLCTMLQLECNRQTCPEMKAGEWLYLCVAHGNDGAMEQCCAIDYILHTIDSATALLNSPRAFPSRLQIPTSSHRHFSALARRLGRIFAHAYFHHREAFEQAEAESSLYARFLALTQKFDLVPAEFLVIPPRVDPEAEVEPPRVLPPRHHEPPALNMSARSRSPPGLGGSESPRKFGRNRTDTMVFSEAASVAEELSRTEHPDVPTIPLEKAPEIHDKPLEEPEHDEEHTEPAIEEAAANAAPNTDTTAALEEDPFADEYAAPSHAEEPTSHDENISSPPTEDAAPSRAEDVSPEHDPISVPRPTESTPPSDETETAALDAPTPAAEADPIMPATEEAPAAGADTIEEMEEPSTSDAPDHAEDPAEPTSSSIDPKDEYVATSAEAEAETSQDEEPKAHSQDEENPVELAEADVEKPAEVDAGKPANAEAGTSAEEAPDAQPEAAHQDSEETPAEDADASSGPSYAAAVAEGTEEAEANEAHAEHKGESDSEHKGESAEAHDATEAAKEEGEAKKAAEAAKDEGTTIL